MFPYSKRNFSENKEWNACAYVRISRDDGDKNESDSIKNQKLLIAKYAESMPEITICLERVDDGFSGVDFNRPAFKLMLEDIKSGKINCVIVKDLSRFGRNWIETGRFIEQLFPYIGVRFISINDNFDSLYSKTTADSIVIPFKNLINDAYSRDISIKTKSQLEIKRRNGEFIGAFPVYGYKKDPQIPNKLIIDEYAASVIRNIFTWKIEGMSNQGISDLLNTMGVLSPYEYKQKTEQRFKSSFKTKDMSQWSAIAISRILKNEVYLGVLEQGKSYLESYKIKKRTPKQKHEWVRIENSHEPIISKDDFDLVSKLLKQDMRIAPYNITLYPLSGIIICGDCMASMIRKPSKSSTKEYIYYICKTNKSEKLCSRHGISYISLRNVLLIYFNILFYFADSKYSLKHENETKVNLINQLLIQKKNEIVLNKSRKSRLNVDFQEQIINDNEFFLLNEHYTKLFDEAKASYFSLINELKNTGNNKDLSRSLSIKILKKIVVHEKNRVEIEFSFDDIYLQGRF